MLVFTSVLRVCSVCAPSVLRVCSVCAPCAPCFFGLASLFGRVRFFVSPFAPGKTYVDDLTLKRTHVKCAPCVLRVCSECAPSVLRVCSVCAWLFCFVSLLVCLALSSLWPGTLGPRFWARDHWPNLPHASQKRGKHNCDSRSPTAQRRN